MCCVQHSRLWLYAAIWLFRAGSTLNCFPWDTYVPAQARSGCCGCWVLVVLAGFTTFGVSMAVLVCRAWAGGWGCAPLSSLLVPVLQPMLHQYTEFCIDHLYKSSTNSPMATNGSLPTSNMQETPLLHHNHDLHTAALSLWQKNHEPTPHNTPLSKRQPITPPNT